MILTCWIPNWSYFYDQCYISDFIGLKNSTRLKKRSKGSRRRTDPSNKYPTCLKTVRREQIVRLFAQTSLHTVESARRIGSTHKSMDMYVGVEQALKPAPHLRTFPWICASNLNVAQIRGIVRARCVSTWSHKSMELCELDVYPQYASKSYTAKRLPWWKDEYRRFVGSLCCAF